MRKKFIKALLAYETQHRNEAGYISRFLKLLEHTRCYHRDHLPGHLTASAFVVDCQAARVLLVRHARLGRWLQPGGHADGDEDLQAVAFREVLEETGIRNAQLLQPSFFDIDIHPIPAHAGFPGHDHYDVRYLLEADASLPVTVSEESLDVRWIELSRMEHFTRDPSIQRMKNKYLAWMA